MNEPTLWAMETLSTSFSGRFDKFVNLSGDTLPTLTNSAMGALFSKHLGRYNVLTSFWSETGYRPTCYDEYPQNWHKRNAYRYPIPISYVDESGRAVTKRVKAHFGSQVSKECM